MKIIVRLVRGTELSVSSEYSFNQVLSAYEMAECKRLRRAVTRASTKQTIQDMDASLASLGIQDGEIFQVALDFSAYNQAAEYNQVC
jgi:hypothetical protein